MTSGKTSHYTTADDAKAKKAIAFRISSCQALAASPLPPFNETIAGSLACLPQEINNRPEPAQADLLLCFIWFDGIVFCWFPRAIACSGRLFSLCGSKKTNGDDTRTAPADARSGRMEDTSTAFWIGYV